MNSNVLNDFPSRYLHVRCPHCSKLFSVDERQIQVLQPQFECTQCQSLFYFDYLTVQPNQEVVAHLLGEVSKGSGYKDDAALTLGGVSQNSTDQGSVQENREEHLPAKTAEPRLKAFHPLSATDALGKIQFTFSATPGLDFIANSQEELVARAAAGTVARNNEQDGAETLGDQPSAHFCPRCETPHREGEKECARCGIIFAQFTPIPKDAADAQVPRFLVELWQKVLVDFTNQEKHDSFLEVCLERGHLPFAARKYKMIATANPVDPVVQDMLKRIQALSTVGATVVKTERVEAWKIRVFGVIIALGVCFVVLGFAFESMRNLVGLGATLTFLAIGFRLIFP